MENVKKTYVIVHGAWSLEATKQKMEQSGCSVIIFDLPGHGDDKTDISQVNFDSYVEKVKSVLQDFKGKVILVGHSLAGFIVSKIAADNTPEKIECKY